MVLNGPIIKVGGSKICPSRELVISLREIQLEQSLNCGATQIVEVTYLLCTDLGPIQWSSKLRKMV